MVDSRIPIQRKLGMLYKGEGGRGGERQTYQVFPQWFANEDPENWLYLHIDPDIRYFKLSFPNTSSLNFYVLVLIRTHPHLHLYDTGGWSRWSRRVEWYVLYCYAGGGASSGRGRHVHELLQG